MAEGYNFCAGIREGTSTLPYAGRMTTDIPTVPLKRVVWILGSLAVTSAGITLLFLGMRAVMDIGGQIQEIHVAGGN